MTNVPLITVGITCFNAASTIRRAIKSARAQDWPNTEIIVVDDASTDDSKTVLSTLVKRYPEITIIRHGRNRGYAAALNTIVDRATGEFVAIFDDDDHSVRARLRLQYTRIRDYENSRGGGLVLCYSDRKVVKPGCRTPDHIALAIGRIPPEPSGVAVADYIFGTSCDRTLAWGMFGSCTLLARRMALREIGPFDESFRRCAEWDFAIRAALMGAHFISVNKPVVTQYKTPTTDKQGDIPLQYALQIRKKYKTHLRKKGLYLASMAIARSNYHGGKHRVARRYLYLLLACVLSPVVLIDRLFARTREE